ncbi:hypothetical protein HPP92_000201 [Vanilla planifolia]|uniref:Uncharacterized protein n=1 Tax=Vanilla planifolia TaxID=51239 RepID=A0A835RVY5_VANPL|nr:hypothetical protein HPP92_000201 [Vanilla planifolia]
MEAAAAAAMVAMAGRAAAVGSGSTQPPLLVDSLLKRATEAAVHNRWRTAARTTKAEEAAGPGGTSCRKRNSFDTAT